MQRQPCFNSAWSQEMQLCQARPGREAPMVGVLVLLKPFPSSAMDSSLLTLKALAAMLGLPSLDLPSTFCMVALAVVFAIAPAPPPPPP